MSSNIRAEHIFKSYGVAEHQQRILQDVSITVPDGRFSVILGRSGSGKSTLLNLLAGLDTPDSGRIEISGAEISGMSQESLAHFRLRHIGLVFQFFNFIPTLSLLENVCLPSYLAKTPRKSAHAQARTLLARVGLESLQNRLPSEVSGGEIQRAAVARAMINSPKIILADEPTGNLDQQNAENVVALLRDISHEDKTTLLIVSHDPIVEKFADHTFQLVNGKFLS